MRLGNASLDYEEDVVCFHDHTFRASKRKPLPMKIAILDDYANVVRDLPCFRKLEGHDVKVWNHQTADLGVLAEMDDLPQRNKTCPDIG
jgi:hypothetical protein